MSRGNDEDRIKALAEFLDVDFEETQDWEVNKYNMIETDGEEYYVLTDDEADDEFNRMQENTWDDLGLEAFSKNFKQWILKHAVDEESFWRDYQDNIQSMIEDSPESYSTYIEDYDSDIRKGLLKELKKEIHNIKSGKSTNVGELVSNLLGPDEFDPDDYDHESVDEEFDNYIKEAEKTIEDARTNDLIEEICNIDTSWIWDFVEPSDIAQDYIKQYKSPADYLKEFYREDDEEFSKALEPYLDKEAIFDEVKDQDGRGNTIASYDSEENEVKIGSTWYYIYRTN